ncbi:hypothetical protein AB0B25_06765 [Nocardia sp. NPDC049190]|uniref:hypothetical protein n=1 Tax=Nocardia sp. NPDC049190 TaxID=3155650 RepID=UPI0033CDC03A
MFAPALVGDPHFAVLVEAAFGADPGLAVAELPPATDALGSWLRAVVLGGQGRYAAARVELRRVCNHSTDPTLLSLAGSTQGSLLRQLGWHTRAAAFDGRAAALVLATDDATTGIARPRFVDPHPARVDAICDALTGLAADALGAGRLALAGRLLRRSETSMAREESRWRPAVRWQWVSAENALVAGRYVAASRHADTALELAESAPSVRHRVKSRLLVAAATAARGERARSMALVEEVAEQCRAHGLLPLRWASAMLRAGLGAEDAMSEAADCAAAITRRGGVFCPAGAR